MYLKKFLRRFIHLYEIKIAPSRIWLIYWPLYKIYQLRKICFVVNIASGVGHTTAELDFFLRKKFLKKMSDKNFVIVRKPDQYSDAIISLYRKHFYKVYAGYFWYFFFLPLIVRYKSITEDCGLSRLKWQIGNGKVKVKYPDNYLYQVTKKEGMEKLSFYYKLCSKSASYFPLSDINIDPKKKLAFIGKKVALIQIKNSVVNATAKPTDPKTLLPSLHFLQKQSYQLVFVGREKMPDVFLDFKVFNYAGSKWANYTNDILIFASASIAITSGSGISFLADRFNIPYLYLNSWQLQMSMPSKNAIMVPAIVVEKKKKRQLKFSEQIHLYSSLKDVGAETFPKDLFDVRNANEKEVLMALKELLKLPKEATDLQKKYNTLSPGNPLEYGLSRCSHFFLEKNQYLF